MKKLRILIISGPNLNLLGKREPNIYGSKKLKNLIKELKNKNKDLKIKHYQSSFEGKIIDKINNIKKIDAIIINAAGLSHTSVCLRDSLVICKILKVNIHISNILEREDFRKIDLLKDISDFNITGLGTDGYFKAINIIKEKLNSPKKWVFLLFYLVFYL